MLALVQARMGSTRCPKKSLKKIQKYPIIELVLKRLKRSKKIKEIILVTSKNKKDLILKKFVEKIGFKVFLGSENDLVSRYLGAFKMYGKKDTFFFKVSADNPFLDWREVDKLIIHGKKHNADFCSYKNSTFAERNNDFAGELIKYKALEKLSKLTKNRFDREHVYPFFFKNKKIFNVKRLEVSKRLKTSIKFDLDYPKDLKFFQNIGKKIQKDVINVEAKNIIKLGKKIIYLNDKSKTKKNKKN